MITFSIKSVQLMCPFFSDFKVWNGYSSETVDNRTYVEADAANFRRECANSVLEGFVSMYF